MKEIGGYLELELNHRGGFINDSGLLLANGRNALAAILQSLKPIDLIWLPYYTCEVVLEPINKLGIKYKFYHIDNNFEIKEIPSLKNNEYLLYTNYFGIKDYYVDTLVNIYKDKLIVDNAQALFYKPSNESSFAYSPRKFVGVPDGGIAFFSHSFSEEIKERDFSYERCAHLLKRIDVSAQGGYNDFRKAAESLKDIPIRAMSVLTYRLLCSIDFEKIKKRRRSNFEILHHHLGEKNKLKIPKMTSFECPMVYPFLSDIISLKQRLIENKVYVATYWPNVLEWCEKSAWEYNLADGTCFLPIDQRYGEIEMERIIELITSHS